MTASPNVTFTMPCPKCSGEVGGIEGEFIDGHGWEELWGRPVRVDESEFELWSVPACPECGKRSVSDGQATDWFWDQIYGMEDG